MSNNNGTALARQSEPDTTALYEIVYGGDLSRLTMAQRSQYILKMCESLGLNPLTRPIEMMRLNGKDIPYAKKDCAEQLRRIHNVSLEIVSRDRVDGIYVVTARATLPNGRTDESTGAVPLDGRKGDDLANALMKAETKAKRRVTLSICGLSILDESELDTVPDARPVPMRTMVAARQVDAEVVEQPPAPAVEEQTAEQQAADWIARYDGVTTVDAFKAVHTEWLAGTRAKAVKDAVSPAYLRARERLGIQAVSKHRETGEVIVSMKPAPTTEVAK